MYSETLFISKIVDCSRVLENKDCGIGPRKIDLKDSKFLLFTSSSEYEGYALTECHSCKSVNGVLKELTAYAIVYNLVRTAMGEAARRQGVDVERISFIDALRWLLDAKPGEDMPELVVNPSRPGRVEPRVRKRRPKPFPVMKQPRSVSRKRLMEQAVAA